ncbi:MAG TPA: response regulator [Anaerolinea thermolimosa]|uniref:Response regulator n=1 Tax=Anaerolinea thermolimosa TaxID=229919 RepID=A0A3D1JHV4_9CHLR|nr:response regulator [Anaerolinea thermolimosa]GAP07800.1 response regulator containing a CheY-like receiver domain and a GGDEF domain [Anaerolinea thermolimosa]HCE18160.1 response regulator [Anaerolinea thermolimosa]
MSSYQVLLVEDNPDDEELALRVMRQHQVADEVLVAHDGMEALEVLFGTDTRPGLVQRELPRVVLLDLKLPGLSGLEVLARIRSDPRTRYLPVVVLTSSTEESDILSSYRLGANSFVHKPVEFQRFADAVRQLGHYWLKINRSAL